MPTKTHFHGRPRRTVASLTLLIVGGLVVAVAPVAAAPAPTPSTTGYTNILDNLLSVALTTLRFAGLVALPVGGIAWFFGQSGRLSAWGQRLVIGGVAMTVLYFGFSLFIGVIKWIATNGGT